MNDTQPVDPTKSIVESAIDTALVEGFEFFTVLLFLLTTAGMVAHGFHLVLRPLNPLCLSVRQSETISNIQACKVNFRLGVYFLAVGVLNSFLCIIISLIPSFGYGVFMLKFIFMVCVQGIEVVSAIGFIVASLYFLRSAEKVFNPDNLYNL